MKALVALAKEADTTKDYSPTKNDNSIHRAQTEPERQLGALRSVIGNIRRDGGTPSADSIATELSSMSATERASVLLALQQTHGNRYVQRVAAGIQGKLKVGQPNDIYEQEADQVMRMPEPQVQRLSEEEEALQTKEIRSYIPDEITPELEFRIHAMKGGGQPLSESGRNFFEPRFGYGFSQVRVHTDTRAAKTAQTLNARASTFGRDIVFGTEQYAPGTTAGKTLLAHELTHVVQQSGEARAC
jgi:hypothetical protein